MTKDDLKTGMICLHRNGKYSVVVKYENEVNDDCIFYSNNRASINGYNESFKYLQKNENKNNISEYLKRQDIVKIFKPNISGKSFVLFGEIDDNFIKEIKENYLIIWDANN